MTKNKSGVDKNLQNVVDDLEGSEFSGQAAQQLQQQANDRRHQDALNHEGSSGDQSLLTDKD